MKTKTKTTMKSRMVELELGRNYIAIVTWWCFGCQLSRYRLVAMLVQSHLNDCHSNVLDIRSRAHQLFDYDQHYRPPRRLLVVLTSCLKCEDEQIQLNSSTNPPNNESNVSLCNFLLMEFLQTTCNKNGYKNSQANNENDFRHFSGFLFWCLGLFDLIVLHRSVC